MAISRMQEPRQLYGLGSLVKSIGKTVKKVVKSDLGKAALLAAGGYYLGGGFGGKFSLGTLGSRLGLGTLTGGEENVFAGGPFSGIANFARDKFSNMGTGAKLGIGATLATYLAQGGMKEEEIAEIQNDPAKLKIYLRDYISKTNPDFTAAQVEEEVRINSAVGGRVGLEKGTPKKGLESISIKDLPLIKGPYMIKYDEDGNPIKYPRPKGEPHRIQYDEEGNRKKLPERVLLRNKSAMGGLQSMPMGQMRKNKAGTIERDYRETGGFVPVGIKEKADDVPAMLSKNEFVMTADAVRGMGNGNIEKGAQRLYDQMKTAEKRVV